MLEVGCGIGRNLRFVNGNGVGIDHNQSSIDHCRSLGFQALSVDEFKTSKFAKPATFDSILLSHILEHMDHGARIDLLKTYLPFLKPEGKVILITPQEKGQASDPTHIELVGFHEQAALAQTFGLKEVRSYSFPFARFMGEYFIYNEFVSIWLKES
jgi:SAM-dependent methyltransferase